MHRLPSSIAPCLPALASLAREWGPYAPSSLVDRSLLAGTRFARAGVGPLCTVFPRRSLLRRSLLSPADAAPLPVALSSVQPMRPHSAVVQDGVVDVPAGYPVPAGHHRHRVLARDADQLLPGHLGSQGLLVRRSALRRHRPGHDQGDLTAD